MAETSCSATIGNNGQAQFVMSVWQLSHQIQSLMFPLETYRECTEQMSGSKGPHGWSATLRNFRAWSRVGAESWTNSAHILLAADHNACPPGHVLTRLG